MNHRIVLPNKKFLHRLKLSLKTRAQLSQELGDKLQPSSKSGVKTKILIGVGKNKNTTILIHSFDLRKIRASTLQK